MATLENYERGGWLNMIWKGDPNSGKTFGIASMPKPIMIHDFDGKLGAIIDAEPDSNVRKDIHYRFYQRGELNEFDKDLDKMVNDNLYATRVFDSLTSLAISIIHYFNDMAGAAFQSGEREGAGRMLGGIRLPGLEEFGAEATVLQNLTDTLRSLKCHRIIIAHVVAADRPEWNRQIITAGKKIGASLPAYFGEIWHFDRQVSGNQATGAKKYVINTDNAGGDYARTSIGLPKEIDWTNRRDLFEIVKKHAASKGIVVYGSKKEAADLQRAAQAAKETK